MEEFMSFFTIENVVVILMSICLTQQIEYCLPPPFPPSHPPPSSLFINHYSGRQHFWLNVIKKMGDFIEPETHRSTNIKVKIETL